MKGAILNSPFGESHLFFFNTSLKKTKTLNCTDNQRRKLARETGLDDDGTSG